MAHRRSLLSLSSSMSSSPFLLSLLLLLHLLQLVHGQEIRFQVKEEQPAGTIVGSLADNNWISAAVAEDARASLRYTFLTSGFSHADLFIINATSGVIRTSQPLDREALCGLYSPECELQLEAAAQSSLSQFFRMVNLVVEVKDVNDHAPEFPKPLLRLDIFENAAVNVSLPLVAAEDQDTGQNGVQGYTLAGPPEKPFVISVAQAQDGRQKVSLLVTGKLDREVTSQYRLMLVAQDGGTVPKTGSMPVEVNVKDINDNPPVFHPHLLNVSLDETTSLRSVILTFNVTDADKEANGQRNFRFSPSMAPEVTKYFALNSTTGQISVAAPLTEVQGQVMEVKVECSDGGSPPLVGEGTVKVSVADSGNTRPRAFLSLLFGGNVSEYAQPGTVVAHVRVVDPDVGLEGVVTCSVISEALELQALDVDRYKVIVVKVMDREVQPTHEVSVNCRDAGSPSLDTTVHFTVHVLDENDNAPRFSEDVYYATVTENNEVGLQVARVRARDPDIGDNGKVDYTIFSPRGDPGVIIDESGYIIATRFFDHERNHQLSFDVVATDRGVPKKSSTATVILTVQDVNDITPVFKQDYYEVQVPEDMKVGTTVGKVSAEDTDSNNNGRVMYSLAWENPQEFAFYSPMDAHIPLFVSPEGILTLERQLDHEMTSEYNLLVLATDGGETPRTGTARISVLVEDVNDNPPQIVVPDPHNVSAVVVATDTKPGSRLLMVVARDIDQQDGSLLHYHLARTTPFVRLNGENGVMTLARALKNRDIGRHRVTVVVTDSGTPPKASNASFDLVVFAANASEGTGHGDRVEHLLIVVILGCVTGIITVAVIVTIVVIRRADQQRRKYRERHDVKPVGEKAAVELGSALIVSNLSPDTATITKAHHHPHLGGGSNHGGSKDATFEEDSFPDKSFSGGSVSQESQHNTSAEENPAQWNKALRLHQDLLKLHGVDPGFLLQPDDGNSDASGESTTCDSGRGGSEEDSHSTGRMSPSTNGGDVRGPAGSKMGRHLSTFHPAGVSRTIRCNPPLLRQHHPAHSASNPALTGSITSSTASFTDNGQPVKKVSFHDDVTRRYAASPVGQKSHMVDRWQSPLLIGGVAGEGAPPPAPPLSSSSSSSSSSQYPSLNRHQYANVSQKPRIYSNVSPRFDLDNSLDTIDDNTSTTTSGSYQVELEPLPPSGGRHSIDQNSVV
ncbi:protocadherin alpha-9-like isoform X2 [Littorina saxatilis]|uniref:protocadherin alpha-9-like isoform X2 n=1 Tax=Littorina saxatilis TaxID=31220 RepID=UPI0038B449A3